jgi:amidohydrolase
MLDSATISPDMLQRARQISDSIVANRREIHRHPELSFQERRTAALVSSYMEKLGYTVRQVAGTGVIAEIGSVGAGALVGIRADMDALPIEEENKEDYASANGGVMHACGHDSHVACALAAAKLLAEDFANNKLSGRIRFLFQPAEETVNEANKSGATLLVESGALSEMRALIALHVLPELTTGMIGVRDGALLAACDCFTVNIIGKGGHGSRPENGVDPVVLSAHVVQALQSVISRRKSAVLPAVLTIGGIRSSSYAPNVIPDRVELTATVRYLDRSLHTIMEEEVRRAVSIVESLGGRVELDYKHETPALCNDAGVTQVVREAAQALLGATALYEVPCDMGADDFSYYTEHLPCSYFVLGAKIEGSPRQLHSSTFDINEDALPIGAAMLAETAKRLLVATTEKS